MIILGTKIQKIIERISPIYKYFIKSGNNFVKLENLLPKTSKILPLDFVRLTTPMLPLNDKIGK